MFVFEDKQQNHPEAQLKNEKKPRWKAVQLLFVRGLNESGEMDVSKKDWALFLSTDIQLSMSKMLKTYALRWGIEVYFKEAKQHLGFLKEQTVTFASHTASIHLCAIRYLMLVHNILWKIRILASEISDHRYKTNWTRSVLPDGYGKYFTTSYRAR